MTFATGENTNMADSNTGETVTQESSAPENDTAATEASPTTEEGAVLVKSLLESDEFVTLIKAVVAEVTTPAEAPEATKADTTEVSKSETEEEATPVTPDVQEIVKSAVEDASKAFSAQIEALANKIPDAADPAVLTKSEQETADETIATLREDPSKALRAALKAQHASK